MNTLKIFLFTCFSINQCSCLIILISRLFQFIYVNQTFVPAPDQLISNLYDVSQCFFFIAINVISWVVNIKNSRAITFVPF